MKKKRNMMKYNMILKIINNMIIELPVPINLTYWWNFGSLLGLCLMTQIITGLLLSMHYCPNEELAYKSVIHIMQNVNMGWMLRLIHLNGASFFFICLYLHIGRGMYYGSYMLTAPWLIGIIIYLFSMASAFVGYVLPWGQMSYWGATVITNLFSTIPYIGKDIVEWIWGGYSVGNATLNRFYTFHFILPFMVMTLVMIHLMVIHSTGSSNPLGINSNLYKIPFHPYYTWKDILGFAIFSIIFLSMTFLNPYLLSDPENFTMANSLSTPMHIQPEWYFLFAYTILRSIPNKLGGVIALMSSILITMIMPFINKNKFKSFSFYPISQFYFWFFTSNLITLTWLGTQPVQSPFIEMGQIMTIFYFSFYLINPLTMIYWDKLIFNS